MILLFSLLLSFLKAEDLGFNGVSGKLLGNCAGAQFVICEGHNNVICLWFVTFVSVETSGEG